MLRFDERLKAASTLWKKLESYQEFSVKKIGVWLEMQQFKVDKLQIIVVAKKHIYMP